MQLAESCPKPVAGGDEVLGEHFHIGEDGHEIRVSAPTRHHMQVHMVGDPGAGDPSQVPSQVEAGGPVHLAESVHRGDGELMDFNGFLVRQFREDADVADRSDEEMAGRVRELVQNRNGTGAMEERAGAPDDSGQLEAYAKEVYDAYSDDDWPFADDPEVEGGCCVHLTIAWDAWVAEVSRLVERAHRRGLVVYDPQEDRLFHPGESFVVKSD